MVSFIKYPLNHFSIGIMMLDLSRKIGNDI